jgi:hypothetical protein
MSDNYEFMKASETQDIDDYSPYVDKQYNNYINDINNGVYTNNSLTLVNFELGQIYNSQKFADTSDLFCVLPITMVAAFRRTDGTLLAPAAGTSGLCSIKTNFVNLIHQADLQINGKTIESTQPFINVARHFQLLSEMSINDLQSMGHSLGFAPTLDSVKSLQYVKTYAGAASSSGNGLCNNKPFGSADNQTSAANGVQNGGVANSALQYKIGRYLDTTTNNANGLVGNIVTKQQLVQEFRPYYDVLATNYAVWYDFAVIKLSHLFESLGKMGLVRRFDATLRLWVNTGTVNVSVTGAGAGNALQYALTPENNTFSNTCPLMVNWLGANNVAVPTDTVNIVAGLYIAKPPITSFNCVNLANSNASHPLMNCRLYYSQIIVQPEKSIKYIEQNRNKKVVYRTFCSGMYPNIAAASTFNSLINSGIVHPTGVLIVPFIGTNSALATDRGFGDSQWKSPFDSCPSTTSMCSLTNLQVQVGGQNVLQSNLTYNYENFLEQVNLAEQLTSSDFGVSTGLISQGYWEWSRWYFVNVERSNLADKLQPRNINVSFNNNSNVAIDVMIFIFYSDELVIDVETGIITK